MPLARGGNRNTLPGMRYLDPKNDLIFKKVFGEHPHLLISFLNSFSKQQIDAYDRYWDAVRVERAIKLDALRHGKEEGRAEGRAEGLKEGRAEGEKIAKRALATAMLKNGYPVAEVSRICEMSEAEVTGLQNSGT